jgi:hypothetical protein
MYPPLHAVCAADTSVQSLLSDGTFLRLYPFGEARQADVYPYAVWQIVSGQPENYLGQTPDVDSFSTQVDVYGKTWASAREVANAVQAAIEEVAYVTAYHGEMRDAETKSFRVSFTADWITER